MSKTSDQLLAAGKNCVATENSNCSVCELDYDCEDFAQLGLDFEKSINYKPGLIGQAESRLVSMRKIVDFGIL